MNIYTELGDDMVDMIFDDVKSFYNETRTDDFQAYSDRAGWQDWMNQFCADEEPTESELNKITSIQKAVFEEWYFINDVFVLNK